jgi:hypothetical protein
MVVFLTSPPPALFFSLSKGEGEQGVFKRPRRRRRRGNKKQKEQRDEGQRAFTVTVGAGWIRRRYANSKRYSYC